MIHVHGLFEYYIYNHDKKVIISRYLPSCDDNNKNIIIPQSIEVNSIQYKIIEISHKAFENAQIESVQFESNSELQKISDYAFSKSTLKSIEIPPHVTYIGVCAFLMCHSLTTITIPANSRINIIQNKAFAGSNIQMFTIPPELTHIEELTFFKCKNLKTVKFPNGSKLKSIRKRAFESSTIESFTIPPHLTYIGERSFKKCRKLKEFQIPFDSKLNTIDKGSFAESGLENFTIPSYLTSIEEGWADKTDIKKIEISPKNQVFSLYDKNIVIEKNGKEHFNGFFCLKRATIVTIPNFIESIGPQMFANCLFLKEVIVPEDSKLNTIEAKAFFGSSIEKFVVPNSVKFIGSLAFADCKRINKFVFEDISSVTKIDDNAFSGSSITSFSMPPLIEVMYYPIFDYCKNLLIIEIREDSYLSTIDENFFIDCPDVIIMIPVDISERLGLFW